MEVSPLIYTLLLTLVSTIRGLDSPINITDVTTKERGSKAIKRQVKLYSGVRPTPIVCNDEGFQEDPLDCSMFHRCVRSGKGRFVSFRFQCSPGTIFDPDTDICNHPEKTKRVACGGVNYKLSKQIDENEINQEIPTPISTKAPLFGILHNENQNKTKLFNSSNEQISGISKLPLKSTTLPKLEINEDNNVHITRSPLIILKASTPKSVSFHNQQALSQTGEICTSDGFMGDTENCRKFYRCVGNLRGGFIKYEFLCSDPTIWDEDKQGCNHVWNVKKRRCGRGNIISYDTKQSDGSNLLSIRKKDDAVKNQQPNLQIQSQINYGTKVSQTQNQISNGAAIQNQTQINYEIGQEVNQNQTQISYGTSISQSQSQINFGHKGSQTQLQIDHLNNSSQMQIQVVDTTSSTTATIKTSPYDFDSSTKQTSSNGCTESGFIGDTNNCKKFYRCVANGRGSFTRYEFSCGEGTVWDPHLESCNHAWAVKECGGKVTSETSSYNIIVTEQSSTTAYPNTVITSSTQNYYTPIDQEENEISYVNQQSSSVTKEPVSLMTTTQPTNGNKCKSSGFIGDDNDCKKFYRCVDNGNGQYTRYEFNCGEGTVWDSKIEACNHAWAVEKCGRPQNNNVEKEGTLAIQATQATSQSPSHITQQSDDFDNGYGPQQDESTPETVVTISTTTVSTTILSQNQEESSICKSSGFIGDKKDCQKFYRCVDNGNGSYIKYEFSCGEGTVWDSKNQVCNHASSVGNCNGSSTIDINEIKTTTHKIMETITSSTEDSTTEDKNDIGYGQENNVTPTSSTTTKSQQQHSDNSLCTSSGFLGDKDDCTKFYRCVDNGNGGFTKYEFTCGEGTVWDSNIESCNHAWAVEKCVNNVTDKHPEVTTKISTISSTQENQSSETTVKHNDEYTEKPAQQSTSTTVEHDHTKTKCYKSGFLGDHEDCKKFYRCVEDGKGGYIQYEFTCGEGTLWDQSIESCNHERAVSNCIQSENFNNTNNAESTTSGVTTEDQGYGNQQSSEISSSSTSTSKPISGICNSEGFYGDENNCKKFYRCVDDGQGSYTKYDFSCGEGTIWNQDIKACDHESANKSCNPNNSISPTKEPTSINDEMYSGTSTESTITTSSAHNTQPGGVPLSDDKCKNEGFYGDSKNCKKFYRCVDNGKGGYTKYDFTCGEGTIWVQEIQACDHDNNDINCSSIVTTSKPEQVQSTTENYSHVQNTDKENAESSTTSTSTQCPAEGFYGNESDCTKFYRCVDDGQGGFIKYEFTCGEGTAWDSDVETCNHISEVSSCKKSNQNQIIHDEEVSKTTESLSTTISSSGESSQSNEVCEQEGYFGNTNDCTKFYRCVDDGKGGYIKYNFDCGEGTVWDQDLTTCNHPQDVANPSCKNVNEGSSTEYSSNSGSTTQSQNLNSSCSQDTTSAKPEDNKIKCEKAGYYANPEDCKKFYRCVDWDGNGEKFSIFHFECGEGTIWDPQLDTCNHEESVYPPTNCSGTSSQEGNMTQESTTESTSEQESTTSSGQSTEKTTTEQSSSSGETTQVSTTNAQSTTEGTTTTEQTTEKTTTDSSEQTTEKTTTQSTTEESNSGDTTTTTEQTTSSEQTTSQHTSSSQTTTQESTTEQNTTEQTSTEKTTTEMVTTEQTTTQQTTDSENMTQEAITEQTSTTEQSDQTENTTENQTTVITSTTESDSTSTTENNQETSDKECPDTEDDQYMYVCPTSFRRHPKYCNMFYQCTEEDDSHEVKIATFTCPNNTIYDESKIQCVKEDKADKKCNGQIARKHRVKRLNTYSREPIQVDSDKHSCNTTGNHPFEKTYECSQVFLKCLRAKTGAMRGFVYQCPQGYVYWSISRRCEKREQMKYCEESSSTNWSNRWEIPIERRNIAK